MPCVAANAANSQMYMAVQSLCIITAFVLCYAVKESAVRPSSRNPEPGPSKHMQGIPALKAHALMEST
eukprot:1159767-Pelagomonas_calceolata.AAC.6